MIPRSQQASRKRVKHVKRNIIIPQAREEIRLDVATKSIVYTLVNRRFHPAVTGADLTDLSDFPGGEVAQAEAGEAAFEVEVVDGAEGGFVGGCAVWSVETFDSLMLVGLSWVWVNEGIRAWRVEFYLCGEGVILRTTTYRSSHT